MKKRYSIILLVVVSAVFAVNAVWAADVYSEKTLAAVKELQTIDKNHGDMPVSLGEGIAVVDGNEVKALKAKGVEILDTRIKAQYDTEKIEGAKWFFCDDLIKNPAMAASLDKEKEYVLYCNGIKCWRSPAVALMLRDLGFKKLDWYRLGIPDWKKLGLPTE
ncbi:MAG: rhodanese-like domain-containing protein [Nitrospiraceae bacterium]|nr:rhodanese-like domain-containing protein [Nitrospiraceae bacterium]